MRRLASGVAHGWVRLGLFLFIGALVCLAVMVGGDARGEDLGGRGAVNRAERVSVASTRCNAVVLVYQRIGEHFRTESPAQGAMTTTAGELEADPRHLRDNDFKVVPYRAIADCLDGRVPLPPRAAVITFDDGLINQYQIAYPMLKRYGITATFFVVTRRVGVPGRTMNWDQLLEMQQAGMTIGAHTTRHKSLSAMNETELRADLNNSRTDIEENLGICPEFIAYPYGHFNPRSLELIKDAGFRSGRTARWSIEHGRTGAYRVGIVTSAGLRHVLKRYGSSLGWEIH